MLQTRYVDRLLARLIAKLKATGTYDRSLVVVVADHGAAFLPGEESRIVTEANIGEIAPVPLFVKAPRQRRGAVDDSDVETTDVLPTIARAPRGRGCRGSVDGAPARDAAATARRSGVPPGRRREAEVGRRRLERLRAAAVRRRLAALPPG